MILAAAEGAVVVGAALPRNVAHCELAHALHAVQVPRHVLSDDVRGYEALSVAVADCKQDVRFFADCPALPLNRVDALPRLAVRD